MVSLRTRNAIITVKTGSKLLIKEAVAAPIFFTPWRKKNMDKTVLNNAMLMVISNCTPVRGTKKPGLRPETQGISKIPIKAKVDTSDSGEAEVTFFCPIKA